MLTRRAGVELLRETPLAAWMIPLPIPCRVSTGDTLEGHQEPTQNFFPPWTYGSEVGRFVLPSMLTGLGIPQSKNLIFSYEVGIKLGFELFIRGELVMGCDDRLIPDNQFQTGEVCPMPAGTPEFVIELRRVIGGVKEEAVEHMD